MSEAGKAIRTLFPEPVITVAVTGSAASEDAHLHPEEAARRGLADGQLACLHLVGADNCPPLPLRLDPTVALGVAIVPADFAESAGLLGLRRARLGRAP